MDQQGLEGRTRTPIINEQIARMLGWTHLECDEWADPEGISHYDVPEFDRDLNYCLRDILPEIVRRGYCLSIDFHELQSVGLYRKGDVICLKSWAISMTDPPSIARAICEALVRTEGKK